MSNFKREVRYTVIKHNQLTDAQVGFLKNCIHGEGIPTVEALVIESDWPEYEPAWKMIEDRVSGAPVEGGKAEYDAMAKAMTKDKTVTMSRELAPCPFCYPHAACDEYPPYLTHEIKESSAWCVHAPCCDFYGPLSTTEDEAIRKWNARAAPVVERQDPAGEWCDKTQLVQVIKGVVATCRMSVEKRQDVEVASLIYTAITEHLPVYEDVYDQLSEMIEPYVNRPYRLDAPLPASVVDSMGFLLKAYTSPPAPVAVPVEAHQQLIEMRQQYERANFVALGKLLTACLDKVKELNQ